ncbi:hypothetical protein [Nonomuraea basaltis]|uniref:hypothetical protein n=1 Tax=Nonomuraea basaltis TaxID=2495887 RepID=UPI00110C50FC|nr:hypothetical protein [Nonomuraea basaltis]TMR99998.1 hypothetical protein EJK15_04320 [Nonomuraea basaltis]
MLDPTCRANPTDAEAAVDKARTDGAAALDPRRSCGTSHCPWPSARPVPPTPGGAPTPKHHRPVAPISRHPADPGVIPPTIAEIKRLFNAATPTTPSLLHAAHWSAWRRRHQARARWFHRHARLATA